MIWCDHRHIITMPMGVTKNILVYTSLYSKMKSYKSVISLDIELTHMMYILVFAPC